MMLPWDSSCGLPFKPRTFLYLCPCFKDHPKSYMWDKMENHIILCQTPTPSKKKEMKEVWSFIPHIHMHSFASIICDLHWQYLISNIMLGNDITTKIDFKHTLFISTWVWG